MATDASEKPVEEVVEEVSTESPKGEVELQRCGFYRQLCSNFINVQ